MAPFHRVQVQNIRAWRYLRFNGKLEKSIGTAVTRRLFACNPLCSNMYRTSSTLLCFLRGRRFLRRVICAGF